MMKWMQNYMTGGSQKVMWNDTSSAELPMPFGVRQGSMLGPILFILCTRSIPQSLVAAGNACASASAFVNADNTNCMAHSSLPTDMMASLNLMA
jgi:hypothetical protein